MIQACDPCLRRTALLGLLAGRIEIARRGGGQLRDVLALPDDELLAAVAGNKARGLAATVPALAAAQRDAARRAGLAAFCRHSDRYPARLRDDRAAPAVLFVAGRPERLAELVGEGEARPPAAAVVGTRRASPEGLEVARLLGRGLSAAGVAVVSGMALGIDGAAHDGALEAGGATVAVLAGGADVPYPLRRRRTYEQIVSRGAVVAEMPPGFHAHPWCFLARNRIIAALADATIVVEAAARSGSLVTTELALELGRDVGAVPGSALSWRAEGVNALLRDGAALIRDARDALDLVVGLDAAARAAAEARAAGPVPAPPDLDPELAELLEAVEAGRDDVESLVGGPGAAASVQAGLMELELMGLVRRLPGGRVVRATGQAG